MSMCQEARIELIVQVEQSKKRTVGKLTMRISLLATRDSRNLANRGQRASRANQPALASVIVSLSMALPRARVLNHVCICHTKY